MLLTEEPIFRRFWYPTLRATDLADGPKAFTLLGQEIVLWQRADGTPAALENKCPHRSVKLSVDSLVVDDTLRCGYHGWRFNGAGTCVLVPQAPDTAPPTRNAVKSFHCEARYGYVWVCLDAEPVRDIPALPSADDPAFRQILEYDLDWDANALRIVESSFDTAHVSFVHRATLGDDNDPLASPMTLVDIPDGVALDTEIRVVNPADQQKNLGIAEPFTVRNMHLQWLLPAVFTGRFVYPTGLVHQIIGFATPIDDQRSRRIQMVYRNDTEQDAPAAEIAAFDLKIATEDKPIVESCGPDYPLDLHAEAHMPLDRANVEMRRLLAQWLDGPPEARLVGTAAE